jgi:hypothetical protein
MIPRLVVPVLLALSVAVAPTGARAADALPPAPPRPDSVATSARSDTVRAPAAVPSRRYETSVVRVPVGSTPLDKVDSTSAPPPRRRDGLPIPETRIALLGGLGFPVAPAALTRGWNVGGQFGAAMDFGLERHFAVRTRADWAQLPFDERHFLKSIGLYGTGAAVEGGDASLVMLSVMPRIHTAGRAPRWYVEAGPGVGMVRWGDALLYDPVTAELYENPSDQEFSGGMSAGFGVEFLRRDGSGFFVDLHWDAIFTKGGATQSIPLAVGFLFP